MRPVSLYVQGFGAFRDPTEISFDGIDFFALVGPTGAGKSTVIDAMCFALYGSVPRYADERLVGRVVSLGLQETKVSLTFEVGGQRYHATRVVRVRNGKASTPEALLERVTDGDATQLLASSAREMKPAVEKLLGLPFAHFTKCVVLPQGEFARFLHDEPAKRRELLGRLLDLQVYEHIGQLARQRAVRAKDEIALHEQQLADLTHATPEARAAAERRARELRELLDRVDDARTEVAELTHRVHECESTVERAQSILSELATVSMPAELGSFASDLDHAKHAAEDSARALDDARAALTELDEQVESLPDRSPLERARDAHRALADLAARLEEARSAAEAARERHARSEEVAAAAEQDAETARQQLDAVRAAHAAHALAAHLVAGEPCPVCEQPVAVVPERPRPAAISVAEKDLAEKNKRVAQARRDLDDAKTKVATAEEALRQLGAQERAHRALVAAYPDPHALDAELARIDALTQAHARARRQEQVARKEAEASAHRLRELEMKQREWSQLLQGAREGFVRHDLDPPVPTGDVLADWTSFVAWCGEERERVHDALAAHEAALAEVKVQHDSVVERIVAAARGAGVAVVDGDIETLRDRVVAAKSTAEQELGRIDHAITLAEKLREQIATAGEERAVATMLGDLMRSDRFQKWLLAEALEVLVAEASSTLFVLSSGQFSLRYSADDEFVVVDHRNADETRSVRTLSGGETFQASLALALALSNQLAQLSAAGGSRLEAIFLDEGFGTLDAETLDVVAGTIETLGASGRMVGIVTHVPDLAERVPVRFRVARTDKGATVTREDG